MDFRTNTASGNSNSSNFLRPQTTWQLDGHYFLAGWGGSHQLKFGGSYRKAGSFSETVFPGNKTRAIFNTNLQDRARFFRDGRSEAESKYYTIYAADTFTRKRLNVTLGLRWDLQRATPSPAPSRPTRSFRTCCPASTSRAGARASSGATSRPASGLTYALDESRRTIARLSVARYAGQLQNSYAAFDSPVGGVAFLEYPWRDLNGDRKIQTSEVNFAATPFAVGVDTNNPGVVTTPDRIDPDLSSDTRLRGRRRHRPGARGRPPRWACPTPGAQRRHLHPRPRRPVGAPHRRDLRRLRARGSRHPQRLHRHPYVLRPGVTTRPGVTSGRILTAAARLPPPVPRPRADPHQAPLEALDGPPRRVLHGLDRSPREPPRPPPEPQPDRHRSRARRRGRDPAVRRQQQGSTTWAASGRWRRTRSTRSAAASSWRPTSSPARATRSRSTSRSTPGPSRARPTSWPSPRGTASGSPTSTTWT